MGGTVTAVGGAMLDVGAAILDIGRWATRLAVGATKWRGGGGCWGIRTQQPRDPVVPRAVARRAWPPPAPQARPFWVCDQRRGRPRGLVATSLQELQEQVRGWDA